MHEEIAEGKVLAGKYRVERVLGVGGMGIVVSAHHLHLEEHRRPRFAREARHRLRTGERFAQHELDRHSGVLKIASEP